MDFLNQVHRIEIIVKRIRLNLAGKPSALAKELLISESHLYEVLKLMKKIGAPLKFPRTDQSYYYTKKMKFTFGFVDD